MVGFDDCALMELFPCAGSSAIGEKCGVHLQQSRAAFTAVDERRQRRQRVEENLYRLEDWTIVDELDRDLFTMTRFLGIEIRLAIAGTRHLKIRCAAERRVEHSGRKLHSNPDLAQSRL